MAVSAGKKYGYCHLVNSIVSPNRQFNADAYGAG